MSHDEWLLWNRTSKSMNYRVGFVSDATKKHEATALLAQDGALNSGPPK